MSSDVLLVGLLQGRLPGRGRDFFLYYLELTGSQLHIFDGQDTSDTRKHLLSVNIDSSDVAGVESKVRKGSGEFRFFLERPRDGKYIFKVMKESIRDEWIEALQRVINRAGLEKIDSFQGASHSFTPDNVGTRVMNPTKVDTPVFPKTTPPTQPRNVTRGRTSTGSSTSVLKTALPPTPGGSSPRASIISTDSGIGTSTGAEVRRPSLHKSGSSSMPNSGSGTIKRSGLGSNGGKGQGHSADAEFSHRIMSDIRAGITVSEDEDTPKWFWGTMGRQECEDQLKEKGEIGNFVVRVNATGHHIMSFWRVDGVHHHKILHHEGMWRFEKAAVSAEGESLADLLDTYMKNCTKDKNIKPFGGGLFENYTYAWTPQEFDMGLLEKKLKQQKEQRERAKRPRKKQEYTPVEVDTGLDDERGGFENDGEEPMTIKTKNKPLPLPPVKNPGGKSPNVSRQSPPIESSPKTLPKPPSGSKSKAATMGRSGGGGGAGGGNFALMQEMANKKKKPSKASDPAGDFPSSKTKSMSAIHSPSHDSEEVSEPLYANTAQSNAATPYQNMEFGGPNAASPASARAGKKASPSTSGKPSPPTATKPSASTAPDTGAGSEYQNINFGGKKQPAPATKKKSRPGVHGMNGSVSPKISHAGTDFVPSPPSHNHSQPYDNSEAVYQNTNFTRGKR